MRWLVIMALCCGVSPAEQPSAQQLFGEAVAAQQRGDYDTAIAKYRELLKLVGDVPEVHANLGAALVHANRFDEAIDQYQAALGKLPENTDLRLNLALAYYKKGDFAQASAKLESLHQSQPQDARVSTLLGDCYSHLGRPQDTVAILSAIAAAHPDDLNIAWTLGTALINSGQRSEGLKLVTMVADQGHSAEASLLAAETYLAMSEFERAGVYAALATKLNSNLKGLASLNGRVKQYLGDFPGAKADLAKALNENPDDFNAHVTLAAVLNLERDVDGAELHAKRALELKPSSPLARYELARVQRSRGDIQDAVRNFEQVIAAEPDWLRPHIELAALYYRLNRPEDGQRERAIVDKMYMQGKKAGPDADR